MDTRVLVLALPSAIILAALVGHSIGAMAGRRAAWFWLSVVVYGILRGIGVRKVTEAIGASFPYEIREPLLSIAGVSAQEVAGWAIVVYLAWWIGDGFSKRARRPSLFLAVAWGSLFLGAISWAIESAAIGARWWHWTVPTASRVFLNVPAIGIVDWFFVGIDFLLPFAVLTAPSTARERWRFLTLLLFPVHFAGHLLPGVWLHVVHWCLVLITLGLALHTQKEDRPFAEVRNWIPTAAFALMMADIGLVNTLIVRRPELLQSIAAAVTVWLVAVHPPSAIIAGVVFLAAAIKLPSLAVAAAIVAGGALLIRLQARRIVVIPLVVLALCAALFHRHTAAERADLTARLDRAITHRNAGDLDSASVQFADIARDHPTSYVPLAMGAEIDYRRGSLTSAKEKLARAVDMKQDFVRGYRLLAAIDHQRGNRDEGIAWARRGLEVAPGDLQLRYLAGEDVLAAIDTPQSAAGMIALAFEVSDFAQASRIATSALARWPGDVRLQKLAARLASR